MNIQKKLGQKLVMTLLARNEEDIIEECIKFHLSHGVDFIIATDNGSIDSTRDVFVKYQKQGVLHLIDEPKHNYDQDKWVHNMIMLAKQKYQADWVMNVDADEFWFCDYGNIKLALPDPKKSNVLFVGSLQITPIDNIDNKVFQIPKSVSGVVIGPFKCLHTSKGYRHNVMGNHDVKMKPLQKRATTTLDICIFHFHIRSYEHYERKVINGVKALDSNPRLMAGAHIRESYELYKAGKLKEFYKKESKGDVSSPRYIKGDNRLYDYINNDYRSTNGLLFSEDNIYSGKKISYSIMKSINRIPNRIRHKLRKLKLIN